MPGLEFYDKLDDIWSFAGGIAQVYTIVLLNNLVQFIFLFGLKKI